MPGKIRRTGLVDRTVQRRDAWLVVVATEDTHAAPQYLHALQQQGIVDQSRVRILVLATEDGRSALAHLLERLDEHQRSLDQRLDQDEFWAVFDVDHHRDAELAEAATKASQKGYRLAGTNPCFELWLLLHETDDVSNVTTHAQDSKAAQRCESELRRVLGRYNKTRIDAARITRESVDQAIARARRMDDGSAWPSSVGTHVHRLIERLPPQMS